jgi:Nucleotide-sugar transporter
MVAIVVKKFDNIVKQYTQALANMFTAIACSLLFPEHFSLTYTFGLCTILALIAIFMYESRTVCTSCRVNFKKRVLSDFIQV